MPFQDLEDRVGQICLGAKLDVVPGILGNLAEEFIQVLGQFCRWEPVILGVIFMFEDDSIQAGAKDLNGGLVELPTPAFSRPFITASGVLN